MKQLVSELIACLHLVLDAIDNMAGVSNIGLEAILCLLTGAVENFIEQLKGYE